MGKIKKKNKLGKAAMILGIIATVFAVILPALGAKEGSGTYSFFEVVFGKEGTVLGQKVQIFEFSILALLPYVFCLVATILSAKADKVYGIIALVLFVTAIVMFFKMPALVNSEMKEMIKSGMSAGAGPVFGGILAIVAALLSFIRVCKKQKTVKAAEEQPAEQAE